MAILPGQTKIMTKTTEQLTKAIKGKLEILNITREQSVTGIKNENISPEITKHIEKESWLSAWPQDSRK